MCYEGQRPLVVAAPKVVLSLAVGILLLLRLRSSEIDLLRVRVVVESRWSLVPMRIWLSMGSVLLGFADLLLLVEEEVDGRRRSISLHGGGGGRTASGGQRVACRRDEALFFSFWLLLLVYLGVSRGEGGWDPTRTDGA
jgi:hypothetical protein